MDFSLTSKFNYDFNYDFNAVYYLIFFILFIRFFFYITYVYLFATEYSFTKLTNYKKQYVVKNIVKSINLAGLTIYSIPYIIYPAIFYSTWDNNIMHICGLFYGSNDLVALLYVNNLPETTKNHHKITVILSLVNLGIDYNVSTVGRMMFIYTLASSSAYLVNYYLGTRYLYKKGSLVDMKKKARNIYGISLILNWGWHFWWCVNFYNLLGLQHLVYFGLMSWVIKDDIILFNWLCR